MPAVWENGELQYMICIQEMATYFKVTYFKTKNPMVKSQSKSYPCWTMVISHDIRILLEFLCYILLESISRSICQGFLKLYLSLSQTLIVLELSLHSYEPIYDLLAEETVNLLFLWINTSAFSLVIHKISACEHGCSPCISHTMCIFK